jgi:hypothetical protein
MFWKSLRQKKKAGQNFARVGITNLPLTWHLACQGGLSLLHQPPYFDGNKTTIKFIYLLKERKASLPEWGRNPSWNVYSTCMELVWLWSSLQPVLRCPTNTSRGLRTQLNVHCSLRFIYSVSPLASRTTLS